MGGWWQALGLNSQLAVHDGHSRMKIEAVDKNEHVASVTSSTSFGKIVVSHGLIKRSLSKLNERMVFSN